MRLRIQPFLGIVAYCEPGPAPGQVTFLGAARINAAGEEDVRGVSPQLASVIEAWVARYPVECRGAARAA
tara:strand:+ start:8676 stop:8885 length:210 start_codon:yes stop_codon:yes gene_type:complete